LFSASEDCHLRPILEAYEAGKVARGETKVAEENGDRRTCGGVERDSEMVRDCRRSCLRNMLQVRQIRWCRVLKKEEE
jgi:hypothetical protein